MTIPQLSLFDTDPPQPAQTERGCTCKLYWAWPGLTHCDHCGGAFVVNGKHVWANERAWNQPLQRPQ